MKSVNHRTLVLWILGILGALFVIWMIAVAYISGFGTSVFYNSVDQVVIPSWVTHLRLINQGHTKFPEEIKQYTHLKYVIIEDNKIDQVPDWLSQNKELGVLQLGDFKLDPFPASITELTNLKDLCLRHCGISSLPASIGKLKSLISLELNDNNLHDLPDEIGQLKSLRFLVLSNNPITPEAKDRIRKLLPDTEIEFETRPVHETTAQPKAFFELTRSEKKRFLERLKTIKEGDKIEDVVKLLGPPYHSTQTAAKENDKVLATVNYYYLKMKDELTFDRSFEGFQNDNPLYRTASGKKADSNEQYDQWVALVFGRGNRLAGGSTNIKGLKLQSVKIRNMEKAELENLDQPMK